MWRRSLEDDLSPGGSVLVSSHVHSAELLPSLGPGPPGLAALVPCVGYKSVTGQGAVTSRKCVFAVVSCGDLQTISSIHPSMWLPLHVLRHSPSLNSSAVQWA